MRFIRPILFSLLISVISVGRSPDVSVVIRTRDQEKYLTALLTELKMQTICDIEIVLVVDYSEPETLQAMRKLPVDKLVGIKHGEFNHAYSTNLGIASSHGKLVAITNGHSLPLSKRWLEEGIRNFEEPRVAGVTGLSTPSPDGSFWEKLYFTPLLIRLYRRSSLQRLLRKSGYFMFSTTNCLIRRSLWETYHFDENLPQCEDYDWGLEMHARGYDTVVDPEFSVYHSHGEGLGQFLARKRNWKELTKVIAERERPRSSHSRLTRKYSTVVIDELRSQTRS